MARQKSNAVGVEDGVAFVDGKRFVKYGMSFSYFFVGYLYIGEILSARYHNTSTTSSPGSCVLTLQGRYNVSPISASSR